jgi:hypothetical protein
MRSARPFLCSLALILVLMVPTSAHAQQWSGIISPSRAMDWSGVGAAITNRTTQCGATIAAYTGTAGTIQNAIEACPAGQFVQLGAGTFNLSAGVMLDKSNVTLRGMGADQTILNINGNVPVGCHIGEGRVFNICSGSGGNIGVDSAENTATWTAGYAQGTTVITLSTVANLTVGRTIWLDQIQDSSDGFPATGDIYEHSFSGAGTSFLRGDGGSSVRAVTEGHVVTAINGTQVTIEPPIGMPDIRSSQSPGAWWGNSTTILTGAGLENLTIDMTGGGTAGGIYIINATNCWMKGIRLMYRTIISSGQPRMLDIINGMHLTIADNYLYGYFASSLVSIYTLAPSVMSSSLFQNNIIQAATNPEVVNSATYNNVFAYNYIDQAGLNSSFVQPGMILHGVASMNLHEGNNYKNFSGDQIHTSHFFHTLFRNHYDGTQRSSSGTETQAAVTLYAVQRFFNVIGNVFGSTSWNTYETDDAHNQGAIFELGWRGTSATASITGDDPRVAATLMRWGNWDNVNNASRFVNAEVPSGITNFPNPVPSSQTLPASFYLTSKPAWFGSVPWPPIGPDVTGGNVSTTPTGGHANKIPARVCFEGAANDPSYSSSSPRIKSFNAAACYGGGTSGTQPTPPTGLQAVVQ